MAVPAATVATARAQPWFPGDDSTPDPGTPPVEGEISFGDLLDAINPLQHIPILSSLYRAITGDEIGTAARAVGATLYGGPLGLLASGIGMAVEETIGGDPVVLVADALTGTGGEATDGTTILADADSGSRPPLPASPTAAARPTETVTGASVPALPLTAASVTDLPVRLMPVVQRDAHPTPMPAPTPLLATGQPAPRPTLADAHNLSLALLEERERTAGPETAQPAGTAVPAWFPTAMEDALARYAAAGRLLPADERRD